MESSALSRFSDDMIFSILLTLKSQELPFFCRGNRKISMIHDSEHFQKAYAENQLNNLGLSPGKLTDLLLRAFRSDYPSSYQIWVLNYISRYLNLIDDHIDNISENITDNLVNNNHNFNNTKINNMKPGGPNVNIAPKTDSQKSVDRPPIIKSNIKSSVGPNIGMYVTPIVNPKHNLKLNTDLNSNTNSRSDSNIKLTIDSKRRPVLNSKNVSRSNIDISSPINPKNNLTTGDSTNSVNLESDTNLKINAEIDKINGLYQRYALPRQLFQIFVFHYDLESTSLISLDSSLSIYPTPLILSLIEKDNTVVENLLRCGADPNHSINAGIENISPLEFSSTPKSMDLLISFGARLSNEKKLISAYLTRGLGLTFPKLDLSEVGQMIENLLVKGYNPFLLHGGISDFLMIGNQFRLLFQNEQPYANRCSHDQILPDNPKTKKGKKTLISEIFTLLLNRGLTMAQYDKEVKKSLKDYIVREKTLLLEAYGRTEYKKMIDVL